MCSRVRWVDERKLGQLAAVVPHQERICSPLPAYSSLGPVAREKAGFIRKGEYLLVDRLHQLMKISAHEVSPTDGSLEDDVPHEGHGIFLQVKHDMARGMSRRKAHMEITPTEGENVSVDQFSVGGRKRADGWEVECPGLSFHAVIDPTVFGMQIDGS